MSDKKDDVALSASSGSGSGPIVDDAAPAASSKPVRAQTMQLTEEDMLEVAKAVEEAKAEAAAGSGAAPAPPKTPPKPPPAPPESKKPPSAAKSAAAKTAAAKGAKRRGKPWFEEIFDEDYLRTLPFLTPQATQKEGVFLVKALELEAGMQVLDVACGYGRHAMELAAQGLHCVAVDNALPLLIRGADEAQRRGLTINFVQSDMRELTYDSQFDGAYCVFSSFGYFDDDTNLRVLRNIARALKPGARFVLDILNRDYVIADLPSRVWWEGDGCVVLEEVDFNYYASRVVSNRSVVFDDGRQLEQEISVRVYSLHEVGKLLHHAGLRVVEVSGSLATPGNFFGRDSRHLIVVAERRPEAAKSNGAQVMEDISEDVSLDDDDDEAADAKAAAVDAKTDDAGRVATEADQSSEPDKNDESGTDDSKG